MRPHVLQILFAAALLVGCGAEPQASAPAAPPVDAPTDAARTDAPVPTSAPARTAAPTAVPASSTSAPSAVGDSVGMSFRLEPVAEGFSKPTHVTSAGDGSGRLFVVEQAGRIWALRDGAPLPEPFLDIIPLVGSNGNERGLLSVAFHPRFAENGQLFVGYTARNGDNTVARYNRSDNPDRVDAASGTVLLAVPDPAPNHNGGLVKFGPDGYLYIGMGDGGGGGDPFGNGQKLDALLGKLLRIDVDGDTPYAVPADNPFVGQDGARPEIWAYGLRNPWRFAFDRATGDLFVADVGQNAYEEVHFQPAASAGGENYGWNTMEGATCYNAERCEQDGLQLPVAVYPHGGDAGGCSITGGYVYRGAQFPQLAGTYLYTDYCSGNLWALRQADGAWQSELVGRLAISASSFGEDEAGELYLTDGDGGGLYRLVVE